MKKIEVFVLLIAVLVGSAAAEDGESRWQIGIAFEPFFPQGEFYENMNRIGWGGSLDFLYRVSDSALHIGAAFAFHVYGWESRWEPISWTIPDVWLKVSTINSLARGHALLRLQPKVGPARPYLEGLVGLQHLTTDTRAFDDSNWGHEHIASTNHIRSTVFSYGLGGGMMVGLFGRAPSAEKSSFGVFLDFGVHYLRGGSAYFMQPGDLEAGEEGVTYYLNRSRTDILMPKIGIYLAF